MMNRFPMVASNLNLRLYAPAAAVNNSRESAAAAAYGRTVYPDPIKPTLKAPGTKRKN